MAAITDNHDSKHELRLVLPHLRNYGNVGPFVRAAAAFSASELILVGEYNRFSTHGAHGSQKHVCVRSSSDWAEATAYLRDDHHSNVFALVSPDTPGAEPIIHRGIPIFHRSTAIIVALPQLLGGTDDAVKTVLDCIAPHCDRLVFIPQVHQDRPLDPSLLACIALQHFAAWAHFDERQRTGHKFQLGAYKHRREAKGYAAPVRPDPTPVCSDASREPVDLEGLLFQADTAGDDEGGDY
mmetsp:Transcript_46354/g.63113  ORF Transcript_46354/g.63113 Transcript_46354/m.63113 type:complete len:239 (-) Transcript_46354:204-920(-)